MQDCKPKDTPLEEGLKLTSEMSPQTQEEFCNMENVPYRQAVGSLMYLMVSTRPDLAAAVQQVSRFGANPGELHSRAVKRIFHYLQRTKDYKLKFVREGRNHAASLLRL